MPATLSKHDAFERLARGRPAGACLVCSLLDGSLGPPVVVTEGEHCVAFLPRFSRATGHVLVALRDHVTTFEAVSDEAFSEASLLSLSIARGLERWLRPSRVYVASLGAASLALPASSPHLHLHVLPVASADATPSSMLGWDDGVLLHDDAELDGARSAICAAIADRGASPKARRRLPSSP